MNGANKQSEAGSSGIRSHGSLADMLEPSQALEIKPFTGITWMKIFVLGVLFLSMNLWQLPLLVNKWLHDPDWSHGFLIPLFSLYFLYSHRKKLLSAKRKVCIWGLPIMIAGLILQIIAYYPGQNYWSCHLTMLVILFGLVLYLGGTEIAKIVWLPILFLFFAIPIPDMLYSRIALPLQNLAAKASTLLLQVFGAQIDVSASHLSDTSQTGKSYPLTVAEACSGVRSLMAFLALGVAMAYLEEKPLWQRLVLVSATIPVAIFCNVIRVAMTSLMYVIDKPELGQKVMHEFMGLLMLAPALLMLWLISWLMQSLYIEEDETPIPASDKKSAGGSNQ